MQTATPLSLTEIEQKILDFMVSYLRTNTYQPSIREIGERFGIRSTKTVSEHLRALAEKGYLERDPSRSRGVKILGVDLSAETVSVPCFRRLPTGAVNGAGDLLESRLVIDKKVAASEGCFFVRARGDELAALGVEDGDLVLLEPVELRALPDGSTVAYETGAGTGYARVFQTGGGLELHSTRSAQGPADAVDPRSIRVVGRVVALLRRLPETPVGGSLTAH